MRICAPYNVRPRIRRRAGRPCPECLEPGIVDREAHGRWCKPDSEESRARRVAARTTRSVEPKRRGAKARLSPTKQREHDRRLLNTIRLYELLTQYGPVGIV